MPPPLRRSRAGLVSAVAVAASAASAATAAASVAMVRAMQDSREIHESVVSDKLAASGASSGDAVAGGTDGSVGG
eukprot:CAMPEP_0197594856 /NCGR_PEP_ID=MMETSP1326-20131121/21581_1 /TAXON_ID=1155430 /ORGANISM="Genus nov. species nov., Strain RCC2288" /LENGTH=74 /DNA_ID=CAMNT_0043161109 /DNA_START=27 /DNA_END=247 /DNA_ORIENTATION=+